MGAKKVITPIGPGGVGLGPESPDSIRASTPSEKLWDYSEPLRKILGFIVGETPEEQLMTAVTPSPLITMYKNVAARKAATQRFIEAAKTFKEPSYQLGLEDFAERYPRVASHIEPISLTNTPASALPSNVAAKAAQGAEITNLTDPTLTGSVEKPVKIFFQDKKTPLYDEIARRLGKDVAEDYQLATGVNASFHEGTHVATGIGTKEFINLGNAMSKVVPYDILPEEITANVGAKKALDRIFEKPSLGASLLKQHYKLEDKARYRRPYLELNRNIIGNMMNALSPNQLSQEQLLGMSRLINLLESKGLRPW